MAEGNKERDFLKEWRQTPLKLEKRLHDIYISAGTNGEFPTSIFPSLNIFVYTADCSRSKT